MKKRYTSLLLGIFFLAATPGASLITIFLDINNDTMFYTTMFGIGIVSLLFSAYFFFDFYLSRQSQNVSTVSTMIQVRKIIILSAYVFGGLLLVGFGFWAWLILSCVLFNSCLL